MNSTAFLEQAESSISNNPQDRLPQEMKNIVTALPSDSDKMFFDVQACCFTLDHIPSRFVRPNKALNLLFRLGLARAAASLVGTLKKWVTGQAYDDFDAIGRKFFLRRFLKGKTSADLLAAQFSRYNHVFEKKKSRQRPHVFIVELMVDMERGIGPAKKPFYRQWQELSALRGLSKHGKSVIPFLALDPRNPNIYADFLAAFSGTAKRINQTSQEFLDTAFPFFGISIHPSLGYLPSDPVLMDIYRVCAAKKIPVTTHSGDAFIRFSGDRQTGKYCVAEAGQKLAEQDYAFDCAAFGSAHKASEVASFFNAPYNWIPVMETFPTLKLNLGSFGGPEAWDQYRKGRPDTQVHAAMDMVIRYPNVYADIAGAYSVKNELASIREMLYHQHFSPAQRDVFRTKFLHGTGFYLTEYGKVLESKVLYLINAFGGDKAMLNQICVHNPMRFLFE